MSATAIPVFFWARPLAGSRAALLAAALTVLMPGLAYSGLLMSEALYLPVAVVACWALARCLCKPTVARQAALLGTVGARARHAPSGDRLACRRSLPRSSRSPWRSARRDGSAHASHHRRRLQGGAAWIVARIATGGLGGSVGAYAPLAQAAHYSLGDVGASIAQQAGAVALLTIGIPLVGLGLYSPGRRCAAGSPIRASARSWPRRWRTSPSRCSRSERSPRGSSSTSPSASSCRLRRRSSSRSRCGCYRGLPRPQPSTAVIALGVAASALLLPVGASRRVRPQSTHSRPSRSSTSVAICRRQASRPSTRSSRRSSCCSRWSCRNASEPRSRASSPSRCSPPRSSRHARSETALGRSARARSPGAPPSWMDENGAHDVGMLVTGELLWPGVWHQLFWNCSISGVVHLHGAALPGAAPQEEVSIARGRLAASSLGSARRVPRAR